MPSRGEGKGGSVLLITATLFLGYLYFSRRLPGVLQAISKPSMGSLSAGVTTPPGGLSPVVPGQTPGFGTVPIAPTSPNNPQDTMGSPYVVPFPGYPKTIHLTFDPRLNIPPVDIMVADPRYCYQIVYSAVLQATASGTLAAIYAATNCP